MNGAFAVAAPSTAWMMTRLWGRDGLTADVDLQFRDQGKRGFLDRFAETDRAAWGKKQPDRFAIKGPVASTFSNVFDGGFIEDK